MSEPRLLGINHPAPPDTMPRLQRLRHLFAQGLDFERETVAWLLDGAEAALGFFDELEQVRAARDALADECALMRRGLAVLARKCASLVEARDALADEVAELQATCAQLHARAYSQEDWRTGYGIGTRDEREACARLAESTEVLNGSPPFDLGEWSRADIARAAVRATVKDIAAAIRARGEKPYGAVALSQPAASAAQERPQGGDAGRAPPAPQFATRLAGPWHHCRTGARQWPAGRTEPCPECGAAWGTSWLATASNRDTGE